MKEAHTNVESHAGTHQEILHYSVDQTLPTFTDVDDIVTLPQSLKQENIQASAKL